MRQGLLAVAVALAGWGTPLPGTAQSAETLADIRQEMQVLFVELQKLRRELNTTQGPTVTIAGDTLARVDQIEAELARLTSLTEELQFRIDKVVADGTNRLGDLEFRLCELEPGCDVAKLGETPVLGGGTLPTPVTPLPPQGGEAGETAQLAMAEQADFDAARAALDAGDYEEAAQQFQAFTDTYTGGPLTGQAHFLRGEALAATDQIAAAARAYLASFSGDPDGPRAADALLRLGQSLGDLGQMNEACVTLGEVPVRFPASPQAADAQVEYNALGC